MSDFLFPAVLPIMKLNHILTKQIREIRQFQHLGSQESYRFLMLGREATKVKGRSLHSSLEACAATRMLHLPELCTFLCTWE